MTNVSLIIVVIERISVSVTDFNFPCRAGPDVPGPRHNWSDLVCVQGVPVKVI